MRAVIVSPPNGKNRPGLVHLAAVAAPVADHADRVAVPAHRVRALRAEEPTELAGDGRGQLALRRAPRDEGRDAPQRRLLLGDALELGRVVHGGSVSIGRGDGGVAGDCLLDAVEPLVNRCERGGELLGVAGALRRSDSRRLRWAASTKPEVTAAVTIVMNAIAITITTPPTKRPNAVVGVTSP